MSWRSQCCPPSLSLLSLVAACSRPAEFSRCVWASCVCGSSKICIALTAVEAGVPEQARHSGSFLLTFALLRTPARPTRRGPERLPEATGVNSKVFSSYLTCGCSARSTSELDQQEHTCRVLRQERQKRTQIGPSGSLCRESVPGLALPSATRWLAARTAVVALMFSGASVRRMRCFILRPALSPTAAACS